MNPTLISRRQLGLYALSAPGLVRAATPGVDAPPAPQPPRAVTLPAFHESTLRSGVTVVVVPRNNTPLVTAALLVRAGPESEPPGQAGVAAMTAALLTKGATRDGVKKGATAIARQAEALGATLDSGCSWRATTLSMTVTVPRLEEALALMADSLRRPLLGPDELERARAQALDAMRVSLGNPGEVARMAMRRVFWGDTPFGSVAPPKALKRIVRHQVLGFHARQLLPNRTVLVLAGDVSPEQGRELAQRYFGVWLPASEAALPAVLKPPEPIDAPLLLIDMPGSGQSSVLVSAPFAAEGDADRRIGQVASAVLGGGYSARLNQEVRIKRGLSYGAFSEAESQPTGGMFSARTQTHHPTAAQVLQLMRDEMQRLGDAPPAADELAARQATLVGSFARRLDTTSGLAMLVLGQKAQGRPLADLNRYVTDVLAVTPEQVREFARSHWQGKQLRAVIAGDLAVAGDSLKAVDAGAQRVSLADLDMERLGQRSKR
ncbi:MAG: insulinase family protein [Ideonella sp.]|nr:insulinase family protein [Ideonella sp.]